MPSYFIDDKYFPKEVDSVGDYMSGVFEQNFGQNSSNNRKLGKLVSREVQQNVNNEGEEIKTETSYYVQKPSSYNKPTPGMTEINEENDHEIVRELKNKEGKRNKMKVDSVTKEELIDEEDDNSSNQMKFRERFNNDNQMNFKQVEEKEEKLDSKQSGNEKSKSENKKEEEKEKFLK